MKDVLRLCAFQFFCIFVFSMVYYYYFINDIKLPHDKRKKPTYIDCLSYSTSITSGTGCSGIVATSSGCSMVANFQQSLLVAANVLIVYHLLKL